ncbi:MAG: DNA repair protein RecN [Clostridia bacterium]|nr:DNA repair protein RecN [Clostridia bacterium]
MISSLSIKNIALIQELTISLGRGLNILSGETGAGKSIIIDSLHFVLGDRADRSLIRHGENAARVEVVFDINNPDIGGVLEEYGIENDDYIIINRMMTEDRSECRINGRIVTLATLRAVVGNLVDIHSQNEHQSLMKLSTQLKLLDDYSPLTAPKRDLYQSLLKDYRRISEDMQKFGDEEDRNREISLLSYQVDEISKAKPLEGEEEKLFADRNKYYNYQKISGALTSASDCLGGEMTECASTKISKAYSELSYILKYDESLSGIIDRLESARIEIDDISQSIADKLSGEGIETLDIDRIEKRLEEIRLLKKKYGKTIQDIENYLSRAKERLDVLENAEFNISKLDSELKKVKNELANAARALSTIRKDSARSFSKAIVRHLDDLGMKNTVFEIRIDFPDREEEIFSALTPSGVDKVEFLLSPNIGEPVKPLSKIASGGEMSRFMLALKNVIADIDDIDTLVFDEIDTGISGKIAKEVAKKLYNIAVSRQVIAVTHLPQLASMSDCHYLISKSVKEGKTVTDLELLDEQNTYAELMRLAGSAENSEIGLSHAKELKKWADDYKLLQMPKK